MPDTASLVALVVAGVALVVAGAQLTQQLLATAYVLRKCDSIVTGGLIKGGTRKWHWRQFRFTVHYQIVVFTLPPSIYESLGITSTIQISSPSPEVWRRAKERTKQRTSLQACWVTLLEDLVDTGCMLETDIGIRQEAGDRIPDDLTVAPTRVDCMALLLTSIAMGMQIYKYSPTTGELTFGGIGNLSSSAHPVLGGLLHYSAISEDPKGRDLRKRHCHALRHSEGVWANAVFGRFRDRSFRPEMVPLNLLMDRKYSVLQENGWSVVKPEEDMDTIGGAASFMAFGDVDVYELVPPSVVRSYAAHFAEVIVKAHHIEVVKLHLERQDNSEDSPKSHTPKLTIYNLITSRCSSPTLFVNPLVDAEKVSDLQKELESGQVTAVKDLPSQGIIECLRTQSVHGYLDVDDLYDDGQDPSTYCSSDLLWEMIRHIDVYLQLLYKDMPSNEWEGTRHFSECIVAKATRTLSKVGPPSWGNASQALKGWHSVFAATCQEVMKTFQEGNRFELLLTHILHRRLCLFAELSLLRSAYFTVMMRATPPLGSGLTPASNIETALAYMA